jgi:hypothetical protein
MFHCGPQSFSVTHVMRHLPGSHSSSPPVAVGSTPVRRRPCSSPRIAGGGIALLAERPGDPRVVGSRMQRSRGSRSGLSRACTTARTPAPIPGEASGTVSGVARRAQGDAVLDQDAAPEEFRPRLRALARQGEGDVPARRSRAGAVVRASSDTVDLLGRVTLISTLAGQRYRAGDCRPRNLKP